MKITGIKTIVVNANTKNWIFVKVETDEGIYGWGEASLEHRVESVLGCIKDLEHYIIGLDPRRIEHLYQTMYRQPFWRAGVIGMSALSGIEMACWDIFGKSLNVPVYQLLGGKVRDRIRMYDHPGGGNADTVYFKENVKSMTEASLQSVAEGFTAIKVMVVPRTAILDGNKVLNHAQVLMESIRNAVGDEIDIMVDFHGRTTPDMGIQFAKVLAPYRPFFIEEPCLPENVLGMVKVAQNTDIPIATGERLVTRFQFRELLEKGAVAVIQPNISHCGGLWEAKKIAAMAETYYVSVAPHNPLGPITTAAAIHFATSTPNWLIQESFRKDVAWRDEVVINPVQIEKGYALPSERPGLGIEIDEKEAAKHPFKQDAFMRYFNDDGSVGDF